MSLNGQAKKAYKHFLDRSMTNTPRIEEPTMGGLMNRSRPVKNTNTDVENSDYLIEQFTQLQILRAGLNNG